MRGVPKACWAVVLAGAVAVACADDFLEYEGIPGRPTPARLVSWVPAVEVAVNGGPPGSFLVDTGAPLTMLDDASHPQLLAGVHDVALSGFGLEFPATSAAVFEVFPGGGAAFDGIIGGDLLRHFTLSVDYRDSRVWLDDAPGGALPAELDASALEPAIAIESRVRGGGSFRLPGEAGSVRVPATRVLVSASLEGAAPIWLLVDTGASAVVLEPSLLPDDPARPRLEGVTVGTAAGPMSAAFTRVAVLELLGAGGDAVVEVGVAALVLPDDTLLDGLAAEVGVPVRGLIGGSLLRNHVTSIDYAAAGLTMWRHRSLDHVDPDEFVRVGFTLRPDGAGTWRVHDVYPDTTAAAAGLQRGDAVVELDGVAITGAAEGTVAGLLAAFSVGEQVPVGIARGAGVELLHVAVEDLLPAYP